MNQNELTHACAGGQREERDGHALFKQAVNTARTECLFQINELKTLRCEQHRYPLPPRGDRSEVLANLTLAVRHLEDARMRLGKAVQAYEGEDIQRLRSKAEELESMFCNRGPRSLKESREHTPGYDATRAYLVYLIRTATDSSRVCSPDIENFVDGALSSLKESLGSEQVRNLPPTDDLPSTQE